MYVYNMNWITVYMAGIQEVLKNCSKNFVYDNYSKKYRYTSTLCQVFLNHPSKDLTGTTRAYSALQSSLSLSSVNCGLLGLKTASCIHESQWG